MVWVVWMVWMVFDVIVDRCVLGTVGAGNGGGRYVLALTLTQ